MVEPVLAFLLQKMEAGAGVQKPAVKDVATILNQAIKSCLTDCDDTDLRHVASFSSRHAHLHVCERAFARYYHHATILFPTPNSKSCMKL